MTDWRAWRAWSREAPESALQAFLDRQARELGRADQMELELHDPDELATAVTIVFDELAHRINRNRRI